MSTIHRRSCADEAAAASLPSLELPVDLLLEIVARCDGATILRCAGASKDLRHAILSGDFRQRLSLVAAANAGGFQHACLLGASFWRVHKGAIGGSLRLPWWEDLPPPATHRLRPVVSRDGVLLVRVKATVGDGRSMSTSTQWYVYNSSNAHVTTVLSHKDYGEFVDFEVSRYPPALLTVGGDAFELLYLDEDLSMHYFSSYNGVWTFGGAAHLDRPLPAGFAPVRGSLPAVVGRTVYWLICKTPPVNNAFADHDVAILAVQVDAATATTIQLPERRVTSRMLGASKNASELLLGRSPDGKHLALVATLGEDIAMWTMPSPPPPEPEKNAKETKWSQPAVIASTRGIDKRIARCGWRGLIRFLGFGERSGAVLLHMERVGFVQLSLVTGEAAVLRRESSDGGDNDHIHTDSLQAFLRETDMPSLLASMKSF